MSASQSRAPRARRTLSAALYGAQYAAFLALAPAAAYASAVTITYGALEDLVHGGVTKLAERVVASEQAAA